MKTLINIILLCLLTMSVQAQLPELPVNNLRTITPLENNLYSLLVLSKDSVPLYRGVLSSVDPEVRNGTFFYFYPDGKLLAKGVYRDNYPVGDWTYFDRETGQNTTISYNDAYLLLGDGSPICSVDSTQLDNFKKSDLKMLNKDGSFDIVDELPYFRDKFDQHAFNSYIDSVAVLPAYFQVLKIGKTVRLRFTVDAKGKIHSPVIVHSGGPDLDMEALRVLANSEAWKPGRLNDIAVASRIETDFQFSPESQNNHNGEYYLLVDEMPLFRGDNPATAFRDYIGETLVYPKEAMKNGISGRVIVQFAVLPDGSVGEIVVVRGVHPLLDDEAIRVVGLSPRWTPGKQGDKNISILFTFPINFNLPEDE